MSEKSRSWPIRLFLVLAWTVLCGVWWASTITSMATDPEVLEGGHTALGAGTMCATGCVGSVWFGVLVVALVIYSLIRRG